jgi:hypothetical protein
VTKNWENSKIKKSDNTNTAHLESEI